MIALVPPSEPDHPIFRGLAHGLKSLILDFVLHEITEFFEVNLR